MIPIGSKFDANVALFGSGEFAATNLNIIYGGYQYYLRYSSANSAGTVKEALEKSRHFTNINVTASRAGGAWQIKATTIVPFDSDANIKAVIKNVLIQQGWSINNITVVLTSKGDNNLPNEYRSQGVVGNVDDKDAAIRNAIGNFTDYTGNLIKDVAPGVGISGTLVLGAVLLVLVLRD